MLICEKTNTRLHVRADDTINAINAINGIDTTSNITNNNPKIISTTTEIISINTNPPTPQHSAYLNLPWWSLAYQPSNP